MSVPFEGAVSCGTVGSATVGPAAPAASTFTPWLETSAIRWPVRVWASPWPRKMRRPVAPLSATWMLPAVSRSGRGAHRRGRDRGAAGYVPGRRLEVGLPGLDRERDPLLARDRVLRALLDRDEAVRTHVEDGPVDEANLGRGNRSPCARGRSAAARRPAWPGSTRAFPPASPARCPRGMRSGRRSRPRWRPGAGGACGGRRETSRGRREARSPRPRGRGSCR